jgi:hypothetical protein
MARDRIGTDFYSNEKDDKGRSIRSTQIPNKIQREIEDIVAVKFNEMCNNAGLPETQKERVSFFYFYGGIKKYMLIIILALVTMMATNFFGGYDLVRKDGKHEGN